MGHSPLASKRGSANAKFAILVVLVLIAVGVYLAVQFNFLDMSGRLREWFSSNPTPENNNAANNERPADGNDGDAQPVLGLGPPPDDTPHRKTWPKPLPDTLTIKREVNGITVRIELVLVKQGLFVQGEDDGVIANAPKHWTFLDDFYIGRTEFTNEQYFTFILEDGYAREKFWSREGWEWARAQVNPGNGMVGWTREEKSRRLRALTSPDRHVTFEGLSRPDGDAVGNATYFIGTFKEMGRNLECEHSEGLNGRAIVRIWDPQTQGMKKISGRALHETPAMAKFRYNSESNGRLTIAAPGDSLMVIAYLDGLDEPPVYYPLYLNSTKEFGAPRGPVCFINWYEADACARYFGGRLPTEAEWEKAARGTDGRAFPWEPSEKTLTLAEQREQVKRNANFDSHKVTEVGSFEAGKSFYGAYDMCGGVNEWTADCYEQSAYTKQTYGWVNPRMKGDPRQYRSIRGCSREDEDLQVAKVFYRRNNDPEARHAALGFRIAFKPEDALKLAGK